MNFSRKILLPAAAAAVILGAAAIPAVALARSSPVTYYACVTRKTGALIQASVLLGALAAGVTQGPELDALARFGAEVGLAFQIQDDILDVEGDPALLGKTTGADAAHAKPTYPSTVGLDASRARARELRDAAIAALEPCGSRVSALAELARFIVSRES